MVVSASFPSFSLVVKGQCFKEGGQPGNEGRNTKLEFLSKMPTFQWLRGVTRREEHTEGEGKVLVIEIIG